MKYSSEINFNRENSQFLSNLVLDIHIDGKRMFFYSDFEKYKARGEKLKVSIIGMFMITNDTPKDLVDEVIESITVYGILQVSDALKAALTKSGKLK